MVLLEYAVDLISISPSINLSCTAGIILFNMTNLKCIFLVRLSLIRPRAPCNSWDITGALEAGAVLSCRVARCCDVSESD